MPRKRARDGGTDQSKAFRAKVRLQMDDDRGSPKGAEDAIDRMVADNVKHRGLRRLGRRADQQTVMPDLIRHLPFLSPVK